MSECNDGGPAFPPQDRVLITPTLDREAMQRIKDTLDRDTHKGMSLRDYFAAHALLVMQNADVLKLLAQQEGLFAEIIAKGAYELADAMLKEREK